MDLPLKVPNELASEYEPAIKSALVAEFALVPDTLHLLLEDEDGAYWSREESGTLCVLVLGQENGHLYLVTGRWDEPGFRSLRIQPTGRNANHVQPDCYARAHSISAVR
jgi:hypothetical protein